MKMTKLKNIYTGEIVHCRDISKTVTNGDTLFIRVHHPENPDREYLVNQTAFQEV